MMNKPDRADKSSGKLLPLPHHNKIKIIHFNTLLTNITHCNI